MSRPKRWTYKRCEAALNAITSMLVGEDNASDWGPDVTREELEAARDILIDTQAKIEGRSR